MSLIIEFGSRKQGCHDLYSDIDLLLVFDDQTQVNNEKMYFERLGYSVTTFSTERARYLSKIGSLFARHVFFEGSLLHGNCGTMKSYQSTWNPAANYDYEIEDNKELLAILENVPVTVESKATINDILVCSIRNVLIRKLANEGIYVFSWSRVLRESEVRGFINRNDVNVLYMARHFKNMYRGGVFPIINGHLIEALEFITQKVIDDKRKIKAGRHKDITSLPDKQIEGSYAQLRSIELLCSHYNFDKSMAKYVIATKDPSYFCSLGPNKALQRTSR